MLADLQNLVLRPTKKAAVARNLAKLPGFRRNGYFYLGTCNADVLAGYCIDAPPSGIYIWRFAIPAYDNVEFLHMTLGQRILAFSYSELSGTALSNVSEHVSQDWAKFSELRDRRSLISYIQNKAFDGHYASWTKFITSVRDRDFAKASELEAEFLTDATHVSTSLVGRNVDSLFQAKSENGWEGAFDLLDAWSKKSVARYCAG